MFYEVRISDENGNLKRKISESELAKIFWKKIYAEDEKSNGSSQKVSKVGIHKKLRETYPHLYEPIFNFNY